MTTPARRARPGARRATAEAAVSAATESRTRRAVTAFLDALKRGDIDTLRATLTRGKFRFEGPLDQFDDVERFLTDITRYALILTGVETRRMLVEGTEACVMLTYITCLGNLTRTRAAAWIATDDKGLICRIESYLDPRAYTQMFEARAHDPEARG